MSPTEEQMQEILRNSFKDFHVKGFDYICLKRSPERTEKYYFFEGDVAQAPEVVHPHDHRYDFITQVLAGRAANLMFEYDLTAEPMQEFEYRTPLLGGNGFTWKRSTGLRKTREREYGPGDMYWMAADDFHTIRVRPDTVLRLVQFRDVVPVGTPTKCFSKEREPINLSGLYNKFTASSPQIDEVLRRIAQIATARMSCEGRVTLRTGV
jgi:hypothetical protein